MADENPTGHGTTVVLDLPADQVRFLRGTLADVREGVQDELRHHSREPKDPKHLRREEAAYGRLLAALDERAIVPDADVRAVVVDLAEVIDKATSTAGSSSSTTLSKASSLCSNPRRRDR